MKKYMNQNNTTALFNALAAFAVFSVAATVPEMAQAAQDFKALTTQAAGESNGILQVVQVGSYIGGTIMGVSTLMDAKKYSDNPGGGSLGKVVGKGAVAAALLSAPTVLANIQSSLLTEKDTVEFQKFNGVSTDTPAG